MTMLARKTDGGVGKVKASWSVVRKAPSALTYLQQWRAEHVFERNPYGNVQWRRRLQCRWSSAWSGRTIASSFKTRGGLVSKPSLKANCGISGRMLSRASFGAVRLPSRPKPHCTGSAQLAATCLLCLGRTRGRPSMPR
jgi:hypothetical protein